MANANRRAIVAALAVAGLAAAGLVGRQTAKGERSAAPAAPPASVDPPRDTPTPKAPAPVEALAPPAPTRDDPIERAAVREIEDLVRSGRIGAARARANAYYERFPKGPATSQIGRLTGAHPTGASRP